MNLFRLDIIPSSAAMYHADHHVGKMMIEACQLMATAHIKPDVPGYDEMLPHCRLAANLLPYTHTHVNHPCAVWVRQGLDNYLWALELAFALAAEFRYRFGDHTTVEVVEWLSKNVPSRLPQGSTTPPQAMPEQYRCNNPVTAYRRYYAAEKRSYRRGSKMVTATWTRRGVPEFMKVDNATTMR